MEQEFHFHKIKNISFKKISRKTAALTLFSLIAVIGIIVIYSYLVYKKTHITTDDAFVVGRIHVIAPKIPGTVKRIYVDDNQLMNQGDLLVEIDEIDYEVKAKEAQSTLDAEKSKLTEMGKTIEVASKKYSELQFAVKSARANLELQEAQLNQSERDTARAEHLFKNGVISKEQLEQTTTGQDVYRAQVKAADEQLKQAEASLKTQRALIAQEEAALQAQRSLVKQAEALLQAAELNLSYTKIYAPCHGHVTKKSVEIGNQIQPDQPLMALVPLNDIWVVANYKETQLERVRPGQTVRIKVDTYPHEVFEGKVESIMAGTGAAFSLFPPENATGNYVKVVQRIPVKIVLNHTTDTSHNLRVGMSVVPTILAQ